MIFILYIPFFVYLIIWGALLLGYLKLSKRKTITLDEDLSITIVIPFRNELLRWNNLLKALKNLDDTNSDLMIIFINDHSDDGSFEFLKKWISSFNKKNTLLDLPENMHGKKMAIEYGVNHAKTRWIFTLDADSHIAPNFLNDFESNLQKGKQMYLLPVSEFGRGFFLSSIEASILASITYSCLGYNKPLLANGAGIIYDRNLFLELDPYKSNYNLPSGDDLFLLEKVVAHNRSLIAGFNQKELNVYTTPPSSYKEMIFRAVRWATKMKSVNNKASFFVGGIVVLCNLTLIPICCYHLLNSYLISLSFILLSKFFLDVLLLSLNKNFSFSFNSIVKVALTYLFYPFHLLIVLACSIFRTTNWKGRSI